MRRFSALLALLMAVLLSAGCASSAEQPQQPPKSEPQDIHAGQDNVVKSQADTPTAQGGYTYQQIREHNQALNVLREYGSFSCIEREFYEDAMMSETKRQFTLHEGRLWMDGETVFADGSRSIVSCYMNDDVPGSIAMVEEMEGETLKFLEIMTADEYENAVSDYWMNTYEYIPWETERIESVEEWDGSAIEGVGLSGGEVMVSVMRSAFSGEDELILNTDLLLDPDTGFVKYIAESRTEYGTEVGFREVFVTYGEPYITEAEAWGRVTGGEDTCMLSVVFNPGEANEETVSVNVLRDVDVFVMDARDEQGAFHPYRLFGDAGCTQPLSGIELSGDSVTVYAAL